MTEIDNVEDYIYYVNYKNNLIQFIIHNCSYTQNKKTQNRTNLNEREILGLLKELQLITLLIKNLNK
tara:strand:- start:2585 stop:2785 length:201 start_codon:yes stop_codon:yes gene_type:complete